MMCSSTPMSSQGVALWPFQHCIQHFKTGVSGVGLLRSGVQFGRGYGLVFAGDGVSLPMERSSPRPANNLGVWTLFLTLNSATAPLPRGHMCVEMCLLQPAAGGPGRICSKCASHLFWKGPQNHASAKACPLSGSAGQGARVAGAAGQVLSSQDNHGRPTHFHVLNSSRSLPIFARLIIATS